MPFRLSDLSGTVRLAVGCFAVLVLSFALLAQRNLWEQAGAGAPPTPQRVLERYHGVPGSSRLHIVLDPALPEDDEHAMYPYLGPTETLRQERRSLILDWVDRGAPEGEWDRVAPIFGGEETCGQCHTTDGSAGHVPLSRYDEVVPVATVDGGMPLSRLLISAHNHMFGFAVLALLLSLGLCATRTGRRARALLILAAFVGPLLDIGGWFLTRSFGAPFHWMVMVGGALFGVSATIMAALVLREVLRRGSPPDVAGRPASG